MMEMNIYEKRGKAVAVGRGRRFREEIDTNVVGIDFSIINEDAQLAAGDPVFCSDCGAVFSKWSALVDMERRLDGDDE